MIDEPLGYVVIGKGVVTYFKTLEEAATSGEWKGLASLRAVVDLTEQEYDYANDLAHGRTPASGGC